MPIRLEDYDVSPTSGFLPADAPLDALPHSYYAPWEQVARTLQPLIMARRLRGVIDDMPVLSTRNLNTHAEWRRAYSILAFMAHGYIWSGDRPAERVPPSISIPFVATCNRLELPPVATYAAVVLWNFKPLFRDEPFDTLDNLATLNTFTGAVDESWFYLVSVAIEARGAPTIQLMLDAIEAAAQNDSDHVIASLQTFAERLDELGGLLVRMYENCNPDFFYHKIRPFLAGSKNMAEAGLPNGVMFDTGHPDDAFVQYSGGSNAQSSIIQFFDLALGIEHKPTSSSSTPSASGPSENFIKDMRTYMPGPHARFLHAVESASNLRLFVTEHAYNRRLVTAYDACLAMLHAFRDKHIQMVSRYIIIKSRQARRPSSAGQQSQQKINLASATDATSSLDRTRSKTGGPKGTGGTSLIPFLKQARDETGDPAVDAWARRLLGPVVGRRSVRVASDNKSGLETGIVGLAGVWCDDDEAIGGICRW